jgi:hypothetical protein
MNYELAKELRDGRATYGDGLTPEEAVDRLWLALNKKDV